MTLTEIGAQVVPIVDAAIAARHAMDLSRARTLCMEALHRLDGTDERRMLAITHMELAYVLRLLDEPRAAADSCRRALEYAPRHVVASLQLFFALADQALWEEALAEAVRYLKLSDSAEYRELLSSGFGDDLPTAARSLADEARNLLKQYEV